MHIELTVNDDHVDVVVDPAETLLAVIRSLGLTGAKEACGVGDCGACTVTVGDRQVLACLTLAARVRRPVRTVESVAAQDPGLCARVADVGGVQCGYCVPGQIMTIAGSGLGVAAGTRTARGQLTGNLCRCTGSVGLVAMLSGDTVDDAAGSSL